VTRNLAGICVLNFQCSESGQSDRFEKKVAMAVTQTTARATRCMVHGDDCGWMTGNTETSQTGQRVDYSGCSWRITREVGWAPRFKDHVRVLIPIDECCSKRATYSNN
jgi:hypothetical protein